MEQKGDKSACRPEMTSVMRNCSGVVGPKSEHVDFPFVFQYFLHVERGHGESKEELRPSGRSTFLMKKRPKMKQKEDKSACRPEMTSMMHICLGLVGPKSENVDFPLVFQYFLKVQRGHE